MVKQHQSFIFLCIYLASPTCFSIDASQPILIRKAGSFQLSSRNDSFPNIKNLLGDCFQQLTQKKPEEINFKRVTKIINAKIQSTNKTPIIRCSELVEAYQDSLYK